MATIATLACGCSTVQKEKNTYELALVGVRFCAYALISFLSCRYYNIFKQLFQVFPTSISGQPHKKYPSWNKNSLMDIFKWFLQFSEKSIPAHTLNDRYTAYSFFYKSFSSFYQIVYPISLGYNKSF